MRYLAEFLLIFFILVTTGCGWHLLNSIKIPDQMKIIIFNSSDPNSPLSYAIRNQLYLNGIKLVEKGSLSQNVTSFYLLTSALNQDTMSIFYDGSTASYQMVMSVSAKVLIPDYGVYPISAKVYRSFFNYPQLALAKSYECQLIINEMYDKIAEELIRKLLNIHLSDKKNTKKKVSKKDITFHISIIN